MLRIAQSNLGRFCLLVTLTTLALLSVPFRVYAEEGKLSGELNLPGLHIAAVHDGKWKLTVNVTGDFDLSVNGQPTQTTQQPAQPAPAAPVPTSGNMEPYQGLLDMGDGWVQLRTAKNGQGCPWTSRIRVDRLDGNAVWPECVRLEMAGPGVLVMAVRSDPQYAVDGQTWYPKGEHGSYRIHQNGTWGESIPLQKAAGIPFPRGTEFVIEVTLNAGGIFTMGLG